MSNGKIKAALFIIVLLLLLALVCSWLAGTDRENKEAAESVVINQNSPSDYTEQTPQTAAPAAPTPPAAAPATPAVLPSPVVTPTPSPAPAFDPTVIPSPVIIIGEPGLVEAPPIESVAVGTSLGSGSFTSETGVSLNITADWSAVASSSDMVDVTVKVTLSSYSLNIIEARTLNLSLGDQYVTLTVPAIDYSGSTELRTVLGTYTFSVNLSDGSSKAIPLAVEWHFGGRYQDTDLPVLECGGRVSLER